MNKLIQVFTYKKYLYNAILIGALFLFLSGFSLGLYPLPILNIYSVRMEQVTIIDIAFAISLSLLAAIALTLARYADDKKKEGNVFKCSYGGTFLGVLTIVCPFCPLLPFAIFGATVSLASLYPYFSIIRIVAIALLAYSIYLSNRLIS